MTPEQIPQELKDILDADAGKVHSREGRVMTTLAKILTRWEETGMSLQERAAAWHRRRFPAARPEHVLLKAGSEIGEVNDALLAQEGTDSATGEGNVLEEAADVFIALAVLCERWGYGDLLEAADRKLDRLETPGAHRASLLEVPA